MTWLVIGSAGQLGSDLMRLLGDAAVGLDVPDIDITDVDSVSDAVFEVNPSVVVNCAAYTRVDDAENDRFTAELVNSTGVANVAQAASSARLIQVSTDYVFDGTATSPYAETDTPNPQSVYGRTKLAGERAALRHPDAYVVRTAWLYGQQGKNFVKTMLDLEQTRETLDVVDDQVGQPTWSRDLAAQIVLLGQSDAATGVYHATNSGQTTWFGLARAVFELAGADPNRVRPARTVDVPRPAPRPAYSVLVAQRWADAGLPVMRPWEQALADAVPLILAARMG